MNIIACSNNFFILMAWKLNHKIEFIHFMQHTMCVCVYMEEQEKCITWNCYSRMCLVFFISRLYVFLFFFLQKKTRMASHYSLSLFTLYAHNGYVENRNLWTLDTFSHFACKLDKKCTVVILTKLDIRCDFLLVKAVTFHLGKFEFYLWFVLERK